MNNKLIVGIQGGKGSFNEQALRNNMTNINYEIRYLYTTKNVLDALEKGSIDLGQFAISNNLSGLVEESISTLGSHKFKIKNKYSLKIEHFLFIRPDSNIGNIDTIMAHPQTFMQCQNYLERKYRNFKKIVGKGKYIDPAYVAERLLSKKLAPNVAVIGNISLGTIYNLKLIDSNLQDSSDNYTTFLLIEAI